MNPDQFIYILMKDKNLETQEQIALFLGISPTSLSGWKKRGKVPARYLIKYKDIIEAQDSTPGQPAGNEQQTNEDDMNVYGLYKFVGRNNKGYLERMHIKTWEVEVRINGEWVTDKVTQ